MLASIIPCGHWVAVRLKESFMRTLRRGNDLGRIARDLPFRAHSDGAQSESGTPIYVEAYRVVHESNAAHNILIRGHLILAP